jgi:copper resistance protein B
VRSVAFLGAFLLTSSAFAQDRAHDHAAPVNATPAPADKGPILYYKNPMGEPDTSPVPKKDSMGMDYIPVYEAEVKAGKAAPPQPVDKGRILYYKNPMGEPDTSPVPKKDSMGMDYIPVYENEIAPTIADHAADRVYNRQEMAQARAILRNEHGGEPNSLFMVNILELQARKGDEGYRWEGEAWYGGDIHRLVVKSEGEGAFKGNPETGELQALYARAIGPYFNLHAGLRYDIEPTPSRGYATIGFEGLAPYWFEVGGSLFVSDKGDVHARIEGYYDLNVTQRLILQPRGEVDLSAQDVPELMTGAGISSAEAELRLRYEIRREFGPYIGVSFERKTGKTADMARGAGERASSTSFVAGVRLFF